MLYQTTIRGVTARATVHYCLLPALLCAPLSTTLITLLTAQCPLPPSIRTALPTAQVQPLPLLQCSHCPHSLLALLAS